MAEALISVGLDVGTTSTQMVVSRLEIENRGGEWTVPDLQITSREILYRSPVHFTPLLEESLVDAQALRELVAEEYRRAGLKPEQVDTGAVIITGETSRKENARAVVEALAAFAGEFVVATAGPDLESVLAARGAGAVEASEKTGETVLHMDIGGGTSNLALIENGRITATGCLNVGGRLVKLDAQGRVLYCSPVVRQLADFREGERIGETQALSLVQQLVHSLEMAAGLRPVTPLLALLTTENSHIPIPKEPVTLSFSGGVADCIEQQKPFLEYGDIGTLLGQQIRRSRLCQGKYRLGEETIRATVIGAGCHSTQLSGSTVFHRGIEFPLKDLPAVFLSPEQWQQPKEALAALLEAALRPLDTPAVVVLLGALPGDYRRLKALGQALAEAFGNRPPYLAMEEDGAKALGQAMCAFLPGDAPCLCLDRLRLPPDSFLDVGNPIGPAIPVVIKTLVFENKRSESAGGSL